jgi:ribosomal-protein-alanine N-acetyltransferase
MSVKKSEASIAGEDVVLSAVRFSADLITLEPVSMSGLADFHEYSILPGLYEHLEYAPFRTLEESRKYLEKLIQRSSASDAQYWFICFAESGKVVGSIGLHSLDSRRATVEVGYGVSPAYWGRGIFSAACAVLVEHVFQELGLHRIVARTSTANIASIKGLEKLGFRREGVMRDYYRSIDGHWFDAVLLAKLSSDA